MMIAANWIFNGIILWRLGKEKSKNRKEIIFYTKSEFQIDSDCEGNCHVEGFSAIQMSGRGAKPLS